MITPRTLPIKSGRTKFRLAGGAQPLILVPVRVNGQGPFEFILDTGAGTSLLSTSLADRLKVTILGSKEGQSAGGKVTVSLGKIDTIEVGEARLTDLEAGMVDLAHIGKTVGANIDGDLGYNFLRHFRMTVDYAGCEIRLEDPNRVDRIDRAARTEVPMRLASPAKPLILVDVYANQAGPFQFAIDTGTSTTAITPQLARQLGVAGSPIGPATTGGAPVAVTAGMLHSFMVGGARVDDLAIVVADFFTALSEAVGVKLDGIVGYNFLRNYKVMFDYPNERLTLI